MKTQQRSNRAGLISALAGGYFGGAARHRAALANWNPGAADANGDIIPDLPDLRAYSRDLARRAPLAAGAINTVVTNVVGTGVAMQPTPDADFLGLSEEESEAWADSVQREWRLWAESVECDITRTQNFYGLQALAFRAMLESGDVFALTPARAQGRPYRLAVQMVEADRVSNPTGRRDDATLTAGVETDEFGAALRYHICKAHPGARRSGTALEWMTVDAESATGRRNVLHVFDRRRPGQVRGVPYLASVIEPLKQLARYSEAEISAAVISAAFAVFVKMDAEAFGQLFDDNNASKYLSTRLGAGWDGSVPTADMDAPGKAVNLLPGESIDAPALGRPNAQFDPFFMAVTKQIGVALELPQEVLLKAYLASYSAARAALLDAWRFFRGRRDFLATAFCQPLYELWLEEAIAIGRVQAPGYFADPAYRRAWSAAVWTGDGPGSIDPMKEADAAEKRIRLGISTRAAESLAYDGVDAKVKHRQLAREEAARRRDGLDIEPVAEGIRTEPQAPAARIYPSDADR